MSDPTVLIVMGSDSDLPTMDETAKILTDFGVPFEMRISSAHRSPARVLRLVREAHRQAEQFASTVAERVAAGKVSPLESTKAKVTLASRRIEAIRAERELETARVELAATWGAGTAAFAAAVGDLAAVRDPPAFEGLLGRLANNPDLARWQTEIAFQERAVGLAKAGRVPDVTLTAGTARSRAADENTFLFAISLPLPLFDRNQGAIMEAHANRAKAADEERAVAAELRAQLFAQHQALAMAHQEAVSLRDELLPGAQQAFDAAREAYTGGKTGYLDVLDAQQTLFEVQMQYVGALTVYHQAAADTERLIGQPLAD